MRAASVVAVLSLSACQPFFATGERVQRCVATETIDAPKTHAPAEVDAVFIDFDGSGKWKEFFDKHTVETVVIQNILGYPAAGTPFDKTGEAVELLDKAPAEVKNIYVGLVYEETFNVLDVSEQKLVDAAAEDGRVATAFWNRLTEKQRERVAGWYLAREIHNFKTDMKRKKAVQKYLRDASNALPSRPAVLIAPYFVPPVKGKANLLDSRETGDLFAFLLAGSKVNALLLQDGMGARNDEKKELPCQWSVDNYLPVAAQFAREVNARLPEGVQFWSTVEAFGDATPERLKKQLSVTPEGKPVIVFAYRHCSKTGLCPKR